MGGEVDGDVVHEDGERRAAGLDYREGSPAASRSEEEDRELVSGAKMRPLAVGKDTPPTERPNPNHALEPGEQLGKEANRKNPLTPPTTDTEEQPTRTPTTRNVGKLDLLPRRHVGRRRPQNRVELRLGRGQVIQVRVAKRF